METKDRLKIYVVDDEVIYLNMFEQLLRNVGYKDISTFNNGDDCINNLHHNPDVIFLDYNMDNLTGYDVLKKVKRFNPNIHVVMISGQEEIKPAINTLKHGAFDYIQKDDNVEEKVTDVLSKVLKVTEFLQRSQPSFLRKVFQFL